ncbi:MAG: DUF2975 domain-containing protein [Flavobacteriaceae bacterium]|nr:DUF2975 domain-containing protein [Flavobacteriaceae bacterium]
MRKIFILRSILHFMLFFLIMGAIGLIIFVPIILFVPDADIPVKIKGVAVEINNIGAKILLVVSVIAYLLYVYAVFLLKKTISLFIERKIFDNQVIKNLNNIGKLFITVALMMSVPLFLYQVLYTRHIEMELTSYYTDSMLFNVAIGLFFMILSEVFKMAGNLKEENELTI